MAKKANAEGQAGKIVCPACQCVVSSDGKTLHKKSEYLADLIEEEKATEQLGKGIGVLEKKIAQLQAELKTEKDKAATPPAKGKETHVDTVPKKEPGPGITGITGKPGRKPWW